MQFAAGFGENGAQVTVAEEGGSRIQERYQPQPEQHETQINAGAFAERRLDPGRGEPAGLDQMQLDYTPFLSSLLSE